MMGKRDTCYVLTLAVTVVIGYSTAFSPDSYTAAVFEPASENNNTANTPQEIVQYNLRAYATATAVAKEKGADIILFPEYGIFPPSQERLRIKPYLELIPNPKQVRVTPCDEADQFSSRPILLALSCMAKTNQMVVVANTGGREPCRGQQDCPEDGEYHLNTNVAFDQTGTLVSRYYKERLFYELAMDLPKEIQDPVVETNFGKFATFICFDLFFQKAAVTSRRSDIDAILFSLLSLNFSPFYTSIQYAQAWAMGNNATLLASNVQAPASFAMGSGIYRGLEGSIVSAFNPDRISKLLIATVPKRNKNIPTTGAKIFAITENETKEWNDNSEDMPAVCSYSILGQPTNSTDYRCADEDVANYTLKRLTGKEGYLKVCNEGMCCELDYSADSMDESYYLGVFNGTRPFFTRYFLSEENCFLARCDDVNGTSCSVFPMDSKTRFHRISMKATFSTNYIYPSVMSSGMRLVPVQNWSFTTRTNEACIEFSSTSGIRLLQATIMGRVYDKDPPYQR